jgi:hypothetical protein
MQRAHWDHVGCTTTPLLRHGAMQVQGTAVLEGWANSAVVDQSVNHYLVANTHLN